MELRTLQDLFVDELQDIYNAENQILQALPQMAEQASSPELKQALQMHLEQTRGQVQRLEQIAGQMGQSPQGKECKGMQGLIAEGQEMLSISAQPAVLDAALIAAQQKVEHYEIACYGTARSHALQLNQSDAANLLQQTLEEEEQTDQKLTRLAENLINDQADPQHSQGT